MHTPRELHTCDTVITRLRRWVTERPDRPVFSFLPRGEGDAITWTFEELDGAARQVARVLKDTVPPGARVLLVHPPGLEFFAAFFGCLYAGAIAVPVPVLRANSGIEPLERVARDCGAAVALTTAAVLDRLRPRLEASDILNALDWRTHGEGQALDASEIADPDPSTVAYLQYTSGSTRTPRGVMITHANLTHNLQAIGHGPGSSPDTIAVCWLPLYHDMGLVGCLEVAYAGGHTILLPPLHALQRPARWLEAISRFRAVRSGGPDFFYDLCARTIRDEERTRLDLSCWEVAVSGAETVRADTIDRFVEVFGPVGFRRSTFRPAYGLAESTVYVTGTAASGPRIETVSRASLARGVAVVVPADDPDGRPLVSCGRPGREQHVIIVDPVRREPLPPGHVGEIWTRGPSVAAGYWARPDETRETFDGRLAPENDGPYLRTGDLGFVLDDELFVTGRLKDVIIIRGANHAAEDIEATATAAHPDLAGERCAAVALDIDGEERLVVVHEMRRPPRGESASAIVQRVREAVIGEHGIDPARILLVPRGAIPRTTSGKVRRQACRELVQNGTLREGPHDD